MILKMVEELCGEGNLYSFYHAVYKGTDCGPMIGFLINGNWIYGRDLPNDYKGDVGGICVSSIVEGSDAEVSPIRISSEEFSEEKWWEAVKQVNTEARRLWVRDNSDWFMISYVGRNVALCHWEQFTDAPIWDWTHKSFPEKNKEIVTDLLGDRWIKDGGGLVDPLDKAPITDGRYKIEKYFPE
jgi:hypothetical protein